MVLDSRERFVSEPLPAPDPPELLFYIEPPVDINTANTEELQLLPSIGPVLAERIILYREQYGPFPSVDSLQAVSGIGPKTVQKLRYYLCGVH
jgi:competence ComEA-like helix-hairpin-helix protein